MRLGYFEDFLGGDTILIDGNALALNAFADILRKLELPYATAVELHNLPFVRAYHGVRLTAYPVDKELGIRRAHAMLPHFSWHHSEEGWLEAAEKIDALIALGGHNWLDAMENEDARVLVSHDEYGVEWWARHFD